MLQFDWTAVVVVVVVDNVVVVVVVAACCNIDSSGWSDLFEHQKGVVEVDLRELGVVVEAFHEAQF